jgi:hypothetical protein
MLRFSECLLGQLRCPNHLDGHIIARVITWIAIKRLLHLAPPEPAREPEPPSMQDWLRADFLAGKKGTEWDESEKK